MKIYDCFSYWDEDLILELRLNILNNYVDYFVIVEGNKTWQNNYKKFRFDISKFSKFKDKIIYIPVEDMPDGDNPYLRENFQRNCIFRGLKNTTEDDLIIISDLDEIPNPKVINNFKTNMRYAVFKQRHFYYKLNLASKKNPYWYGSRICIKKYLESPQWLRDLKFKKYPFWRIDKIKDLQIIKNGGWHFSYLQSPENLLKKIASFSHGEHNKPEFADSQNIKKKIKMQKNIFGQEFSYKKIEIDQTFPKYILENKDKLKEWII